MNTPPILFLVFKRPDTTARVFEAIRRARPERLYVAADGPREGRDGEAERCEETRRIATSVDWPCEVQTLFRDKNLGCRDAVSGAISWFFDNEPEGIILEDDCLPDPSFFPYCAELLERYRDDERVAVITGNNFQPSMGSYPYSYYFSIYNHCWGWASWRRAWQHYDKDMRHYQEFLDSGALESLSPVAGFADHWQRIFADVERRQIDSWAYVWTYSCWANSGLTCTPRANLVSNIDFGDDGTHTLTSGHHLAEVPSVRMCLPLKHPSIMAAQTHFDNVTSHTYYDILQPPHFGKRIERYIRRELRDPILGMAKRAMRDN